MRQVPNNSKNPDIALLTDPKGLDRIVQTLQVSLSGLPWLEKSFGRAYTQMRKTEEQVGMRSNDNIYFPAVYQGVSGDHVKDFEDLLVNDNLASYCFFRCDEDDDSFEYSHLLENEFESQFSIIFWFDLDMINQSSLDKRLYPFNNELKADIIEAIENTIFETVGDRVTIESITGNPREIFREYTIDIVEQQNLVYPSGGFRFNCRAQWLQECF
jgi:hypothetical protein